MREGPIRLVRIPAGVLAAAALLVPFLWRLDRASFHLDETSWILVSARVFGTVFDERDAGSGRLPEYGRNFGWPAPPLGKYLMGASIRLREGDRSADLDRIRWATYDRPIVASIASRQAPPADVLLAARLPMAILGAATCLVVFFIGRIAWGDRAGLLAAALLALNPLMLTCCRRAMIDAPAIFFSALGILVTIRLAAGRADSSRSRGPHGLSVALGLGAMLGLAAASKLNALAAAAACLGILALASIQATQRRLLWAAGGVAMIASAFVFVAVNPYLYSDPVGRTWAMLTFTHYEGGVGSLAARAALVARRLFAGEADMAGTAYLTLGAITGLPLEWAAVPAGSLAVFASAFMMLRRRAAVDEGAVAGPAVAIWWVVTLAAITAWLPRDWERYYLPALPPTILLAARGLDLAAGWVLTRLHWPGRRS